MDRKEQFVQLLSNQVKRRGAEKLLEWLQNTDFFTAPASTRFHSAYEGGLCDHSLSVYDVMMKKQYDSEKDNLESVTIVSLLHDICKAGFYEVSSRNVKNDAGQWEKVPYYSIEDRFPFGHGEKSVFLIERFMRLELEEAIAIRWHMGGFDECVKGGSFSLNHAFQNYPLAVKLHLADLEASYLRETTAKG